MKRIFFVSVLVLILLSGCGANSSELNSKNEALKLEKAGILVVKDRLAIPHRGCVLILEGVNNPGERERWAITFSRTGWNDCIRLVSQDKVKATFVNIEADKKGIRDDIGDWLTITLISE